MAQRKHSDEGYGLEFSRGLVNGLLIAIPLWAIIGIVLATAFNYRPLNATAGAALTIAAVCEALLALPYMRALWSRFRRADASSPRARRVAAPVSLFRQSLALSALVGAYLQYYFLEVNLQIASQPSLTVFLPVAPMT